MACPASGAEPPGTLRVLTYNLHHGQGTDGKLDLERIVRVIRSVDPDIVALQEVDIRVPRSNLVDQAAELAEQTGLVSLFGRNIELDGGGYGNAVLTRLPITKWENRLLPRHRDGEQRGVLIANLHWQAGNGEERALRFLATHFDHRRDDSERLASAALVNEIANQQSDTPMILAGDLNATRQSPVLASLGRTWEIAGPERFTIPSDSPKRQIDYVLYRPGKAWSLIETRVLDEAIASDHRALLAVFRAR